MDAHPSAGVVAGLRRRNPGMGGAGARIGRCPGKVRGVSRGMVYCGTASGGEAGRSSGKDGGGFVSGCPAVRNPARRAAAQDAIRRERSHNLKR